MRIGSPLKRRIKEAIETSLGLFVYRSPPVGLRLHNDVAKSIPDYQFGVIFDVGANTGQSAERFRSDWPNAQIHCFEPVEATFGKLSNKFRAHSNIHAHRLAFSDSSGVGTMILEGSSTTFSLKDPEVVEVVSSYDQERVTLCTIDSFCSSSNIPEIGFLKIDTEGADLDVLRGANGMLRRSAIDMVQVEAGMHRDNSRHVPFFHFVEFLEERGYSLFAIYDQFLEISPRRPILRRSNPVFVSSRVVERVARSK